MYRLLLLFTLITSSLSAQDKLEGWVKDPQGEPLAGVNIYLKGSFIGTTSDADGHFQIEGLNPEGILVFSMMGFESLELALEDLDFTQKQNIQLKEAFNKLAAVTVNAGSIEVSDKKQSVVLRPLDIVTTSGALGNIIGALNTLPGTANNANDGRLFVRGGAANETAIFIDGLRLGNAYGSNLSGIPTRGRFSAQLFKGSFFSTGAYSAEYGQALSSVLSMNSLDFPLRRQTDLGISTVGGSLSHTEVWDRQSITTSLNYTNLSPYMALVPQNLEFTKAPQGINSEILFRQKTGKHGMLKAFYSFQNSDMGVLRSQPDTNVLQAAKLKNNFHHLNLNYRQNIGKKHLLDGGLSFTGNLDDIQLDSLSIQQKGQLWHAKIRYQYFPTARISIKSGFEFFDQLYREEIQIGARQQDDLLGAAFAECDYHFSSDFLIKLGLRSSINQNSSYLMPRASVAYRLNLKSQFSLAYGDYIQEQAPSIRIQEEDLRASKAQHVVLNYMYSTPKLTFRLEAFQKNYHELVRSNTGFNTNGEGFARGFDLFLRDRSSIRNLDYWVSYSFVDSKRHWQAFETQVQPRFAPRHNASIVAKYWLNSLQSQVGTSFSINDGYTYDNPNLAGEMESRTKGFQSLNLSWSYLPRPNLIIHLEITNVLGRENIFNYEYSSSPGNDGQYNSMAIPQSATRFIFLGLFYTLSTDKNANQLNNL